VFGKNQAILSALTKAFQPILEAGPNQRGFSTEELQNLESPGELQGQVATMPRLVQH